MSDSPAVLVTGSSGMIGTALVERLLNQGINVRGIDRCPNHWSDAVEAVTDRIDLLEPDAQDRIPTDADTVIHLAANSRVRDLVEKPTGATENLRMLSTALEYTRQNDADFLFTSSREVYGDQGRTVYGETEIRVCDIENPYGASKVGSEALVASYGECYDLRTCTLRLSNVYGRYDAADRVVPIFVDRARRGADLTVFGDDKLLDFLHVDDCVDAVVAALDGFGAVHGTALNVGVGRGRSLVELAETIKGAVGSDSDVVVEENRIGEVSRFVPDIDAIAGLLGWTPDVSFEAGIERTVAWYLDNEDVLDELG